MKTKTPVGLVDQQCQIQGQSGPITATAGGDALAVVRLSGYSEAEVHAELKRLGGQSVDFSDPKLQQAAVFLSLVEEALKNDGRITADEAPKLIKNLLTTTNVPPFIQNLIGYYLK